MDDEIAPPNDNDDDKVRDAMNTGADLAGALGGGAFGLIGGPLGALGGAALGIAIQRAGRAVIARLSAREEERVGATLVLIEADARQREENGEHLREDGFFDKRGEQRPEAEELLEGVLRQAAETHEERKVPFLARLYSAVAHDPDIPAGDALYLVRVASELTYRQFVALAVYAHHDEHVQALIDAHLGHSIATFEPDEAVRLELSDLMDLRLLGFGHQKRVVPLNDVFAAPLLREKGLGYGQLHLLPAGEQLARLTGAEEIGAAEREHWIEELAGTERQ